MLFAPRIVLATCVLAAVGSLANEQDPIQPSSDKKKITKLQIGVKKRVDNCDKRTSKGDVVHIHYKGTLYDDGTEFDSSYKRNQPLVFTLGMGQVIAGWDQGLLSMCAGEKRKLVIPSDLGYGKSGAPPAIPPDATLVFEVECVKVESRKTEF